MATACAPCHAMADNHGTPEPDSTRLPGRATEVAAPGPVAIVGPWAAGAPAVVARRRAVPAAGAVKRQRTKCFACLRFECLPMSTQPDPKTSTLLPNCGAHDTRPGCCWCGQARQRHCRRWATAAAAPLFHNTLQEAPARSTRPASPHQAPHRRSPEIGRPPRPISVHEGRRRSVPAKGRAAWPAPPLVPLPIPLSLVSLSVRPCVITQVLPPPAVPASSWWPLPPLCRAPLCCRLLLGVCLAAARCSALAASCCCCTGGCRRCGGTQWAQGPRPHASCHHACMGRNRRSALCLGETLLMASHCHRHCLLGYMNAT